MIECLKIEDFVISDIFRPYMPSLLIGEFRSLEYCEEQKKNRTEIAFSSKIHH